MIVFSVDFSTFECGSVSQIPCTAIRIIDFDILSTACSHGICVACDPKTHSPPCQSSLHSINCNGLHCSNSADCPKFQMEREIPKIRSTERVSLPEARRRYRAQFLVNFHEVFFSSQDLLANGGELLKLFIAALVLLVIP